MDKSTYEMRLMQWTQVIRQCHGSGMLVKDWCIENNISEKKFYYWQRRVRGDVFESLKKNELQPQSNFVQLQVHNEYSSTNNLNNPTSFKADIIMHIGNNILELSNTASEELLSKVLKVMSDVK